MAIERRRTDIVRDFAVRNNIVISGEGRGEGGSGGKGEEDLFLPLLDWVWVERREGSGWVLVNVRSRMCGMRCTRDGGGRGSGS